MGVGIWSCAGVDRRAARARRCEAILPGVGRGALNRSRFVLWGCPLETHGLHHSGPQRNECSEHH